MKEQPAAQVSKAFAAEPISAVRSPAQSETHSRGVSLNHVGVTRSSPRCGALFLALALSGCDAIAQHELARAERYQASRVRVVSFPDSGVVCGVVLAEQSSGGSAISCVRAEVAR